MIINYTSSKRVIARIGRMINGTGWHGIVKMYLGDAISEIGYATQRSNKAGTEKLTIVNHKVEIPCDVRIISKVERDGQRLPINKDISMDKIDDDNYIWGKEDTRDWYSVKPPYIYTSFEEGEIDLFFRKFETDEEGFLMIPDYSEYINALVWHVVASLILEGYKIKGENVNHSYALSMFDRYEPKAKKRVKSFSRDERERFARMWNSINISYIDETLMDTP